MKIPKMPPVKFFIVGSDKELTIEEAQKHIVKLANSKRTTSKNSQKGA